MLADLNPPQREAVLTLKGPLLVLAGAGSGKTRVVTYRVAELIARGTRPGRILAVTFTNKAAREMQERISHRLGRRSNEKPQVSTFHSHCVRLLRRNIRHLGYPEKFVIYDRGDQESLAREVLREIRVPGEMLRPGDLLFHVGNWKTHGLRPDDAAARAGTDKEHLAAMGYRRYQKSLKLAGAVDFDDLLLLSEQLLREFPAVQQSEAGLFDHLLVDEYQDTNGSQYRIVKALAEQHRNLCVVGDDDQSIYAWRGAEVEHILHFTRDWPDAKVVRLEDNYRCTSAILELANRLIRENKVRHDKVLRAARPGGEPPAIWQASTETEEAQMVVNDIRRRLSEPGAEPRDFAILFRTNEQPRLFEAELRKVKLPYVLVGGMSFFDRKEVKDVLAWLRLIAAPHDEVSLRRVINTPPRGIGQSTIEKLIERAVQRGETLWKALPGAAEVLEPGPAAAVGRFVNLVQRQQQKFAQAPRLTDAAQQLLVEIDYRGELQRLYPDAQERETRLAAVEQVINALALCEQEARGKKVSLAEFLDEVTLGDRPFDDEKENQLRRNAVALMTLHSAKGLEFRYVYLVGLEEGLLPHHRSLGEYGDDVAEERRLCYVGITRAQERLTLSLALARMKWGKPRPTIPSRFLFEITGQKEKFPAARRRGTALEPATLSPTGRKGKPRK